MNTYETQIQNYIRDVPDFPKRGILFKDITPLLAAPRAMRSCIDQLVDANKDKGIDRIGALDARGFLFGMPLALALGVPFFPVRKAGKLPYASIQANYGLEYGSDAIQIHTDAVNAGDRVLLVDDLLATGGTMKAAAGLVEKLGGIVVGCQFVIELQGIGGQEKLKDYHVQSLLQYKV